MIDSRARLTAPPIYSVQITAAMSYYPQNGYRSRENQCDKPEAMGTGNPCMAADRQDQHPELYGILPRRKTFVRGCLSGKEWGSKRYLCMKYLTTGELA